MIKYKDGIFTNEINVLVREISDTLFTPSTTVKQDESMGKRGHPADIECDGITFWTFSTPELGEIS